MERDKLLKNHTMKISIILLLIFIINLSSCYVGVPIKSEPSENNKTYQAEYLFEHDGCKVYWFYDPGNYVYFTNCSGMVTSFYNDLTKTWILNQINTCFPKE